MLLLDSSDNSRTSASVSSTTTPSSSQEVKAAVSSCQGALRALLDALRDRGVTGLDKSGTTTNDYWRTLQQAHDYCRILNNDEEDDEETTTLLLLGCWQAVGRHTALTYKTVWSEYQSLRHFSTRKSANAELLQRLVQLAERCSACQREVLLLERGRRLRSNKLLSTTTTSTPSRTATRTSA